MLVAKAYLFRLFGDAGVDRLHLALSFSPFRFNRIGRLGFQLRVVLDFLKNQDGVVFSVKSYWVCHLSAVLALDDAPNFFSLSQQVV